MSKSWGCERTRVGKGGKGCPGPTRGNKFSYTDVYNQLTIINQFGDMQITCIL